MRKILIAAFAALAFLGGCQPNGQNGNGSANGNGGEAVATGDTLHGQVVVNGQVAPAAGARLALQLLDMAQPGSPVASKEVEVSGSPPYSFELKFDPSRIVAGNTYVLHAKLDDGERRFLPAFDAPVLTHGAGTDVQVSLNPEATPAERLKQDFEKIQSHIGGYKKVEGTYTTDEASVGWDAFAEGGTVRFARVNTIRDDDKGGGRESVQFAYHEDGSPMVVQQRRGATVGWDADGTLLWNEDAGGGELDDAGVSRLREEAEAVFRRAQAKADEGRGK